jgi:hypothetical protein
MFFAFLIEEFLKERFVLKINIVIEKGQKQYGIKGG